MWCDLMTFTSTLSLPIYILNIHWFSPLNFGPSYNSITYSNYFYFWDRNFKIFIMVFIRCLIHFLYSTSWGEVGTYLSIGCTLFRVYNLCTVVKGKMDSLGCNYEGSSCNTGGPMIKVYIYTESRSYDVQRYH